LYEENIIFDSQKLFKLTSKDEARPEYKRGTYPLVYFAGAQSLPKVFTTMAKYFDDQ